MCVRTRFAIVADRLVLQTRRRLNRCRKRRTGNSCGCFWSQRALHKIRNQMICDLYYFEKNDETAKTPSTLMKTENRVRPTTLLGGASADCKHILKQKLCTIARTALLINY
ncbi:hypothetical protein L596_006329 [Steinernema carpocapsae]|uniref:Uncharacterized protein n=1 Tax=Steinernema carpocapsae TaxID=34508 RepID=A0A4U8V849_STECR|nr:hypothetical protein L596_006329 [Steinernema carpocapsae]